MERLKQEKVLPELPFLEELEEKPKRKILVEKNPDMAKESKSDDYI